MRIWHLFWESWSRRFCSAVLRDPAGRVGIVVFLMGLCETVLGVTALMALFQTVAAIGYANRFSAYIESIVATILVLAVASLVMNGVLWVGFWLIRESLA